MMVKKITYTKKPMNSLNKKRKYNPILKLEGIESNSVSGDIVDASNAALDAAKEAEAHQNADRMSELLDAVEEAEANQDVDRMSELLDA